MMLLGKYSELAKFVIPDEEEQNEDEDEDNLTDISAAATLRLHGM